MRRLVHLGISTQNCASSRRLPFSRLHSSTYTTDITHEKPQRDTALPSNVLEGGESNNNIELPTADACSKVCIIDFVSLARIDLTAALLFVTIIYPHSDVPSN